MPWLRLDDNFITNPKLLQVDAECKALWAWCCGYSAKELTDGFIALHVLPAISAMVGLVDCKRHIQQLVAARLLEWNDALQGYWVHDYLDYNPSREQVLKERAEAKVRMQRLRSPEVRPNITRSSPEVRDPVPSRPVPKDTIMCADAHEIETLEAELDAATVERLSKTAEPNGYSADFEEFWKAYPRRIEKVRAHKAFMQRRRDGDKAEALVGAARNYARYCIAKGRAPEHIKHPATFLSKNRDFAEFIDGQPEETNPRNTGPPPLEAYDPGMRERIEFEAERTRKANAGITRPGLYPK